MATESTRAVLFLLDSVDERKAFKRYAVNNDTSMSEVLRAFVKQTLREPSTRTLNTVRQSELVDLHGRIAG